MSYSFVIVEISPCVLRILKEASMVYRNARSMRSLLLSFSLFGVLAGTSSLALAQGTGNTFGGDSAGQLGNGAPNADSNAPVAVKIGRAHV